MDKRINLKKPKDKRMVPKEIPVLNNNETMQYLQNFFIPIPELDTAICGGVEREIKKKLDSYKRQDLKKNRYDERTFITMEECYQKMLGSKMKCYYCHCDMVIFYKEVRQDNQWTLERINNDYQHSDKNTVISCLECNLKRGTRNSEHYQFAKQLVIKKV